MAARNSTAPVRIPAAAYVRMSSDRQETSIEDQRSEVIAYAVKRGYAIVRWFSDEGVSGWKSKERRGFQDLIDAAPGGTFKAILCWDQSRFSRFDPLEAGYYWHQLRQAGVFIETVKEGRLDFETLGGWLTASVQQHGKAEYCRSLAADSTRGKRKEMQNGKWCTVAPYGYRIENERLALGDAVAVEVVRRIFRLRSEGQGHRAIVATLNREGIPSPHGKEWQCRQIGLMLKRQTYRGHMVVGEELKGKFCHVFDEPRTFLNTHPAIVDPELWQAVQEVRHKRKAIPGRRPAVFGELSGLLVCGRCGFPMHMRTNGDVAKYACGSYLTKSACSFNTILCDRALKLVANKIRETVLLGSVEALTAAIERRLAKSQATKPRVDPDSIKRQIAEIDRKLAGAADRLLEVEPSLVKSVQRAMLALQEKREGLTASLGAAAVEKKKPLSAEQIATKLWELDDKLRTGDPATVRAALSPLVDRIVIEFEPKKMKRNPGRARYFPSEGMIHFCSDCDTPSARPA